MKRNKMLYIDKTEFGSITLDNKTYEHNIKIVPNGEIPRRWGPLGSYEICLEEFNEILKQEPEVIVAGNGQQGIARVENKAREEIKARNINLIIEETLKINKNF